MANLEQLHSSLQQFQQRGFGPRGNRTASGLLPKWSEILERFTFNAQDFIKAEAAIMRNSALSNEGKQAAKAELAKSAIEKVSWVGGKLAGAQQARDRWKAVCLDYMAQPKGDAMTLEHRAFEVRVRHRDKPQNEIDMVFLQAAERLDGEVMRALQAGPGGPMIAGEMLSRAEHIYAERRNPQLFQQWQEIEVLIEHIEGVANHGAQVLLTMTLGAERPAILKALGLQEAKEEVPAHA